MTSEKAGDDIFRRMVGRGSALADIDGDGDLDILITASGSAPRLLRNDQKLNRHWLQLKLVGKAPNLDALGASVKVHVGDQVMRREVNATRSYLSQSDIVLSFGLGESTKVDKIEIRWPDGTTQQVDALEVDKRHEVKQP